MNIIWQTAKEERKNFTSHTERALSHTRSQGKQLAFTQRIRLRGKLILTLTR